MPKITFIRALKVFIIFFLLTTLPFFSFQVLALDYTQNDTDLPDVALVLGAGVNRNGTPSQILKNRLDKGLELYNQGKVKVLLVSGDNRFENYNEPKVMREYLESQGVSSESIVEDFAGRRTLDSCYRAKNVFKAKSVTIVTQAFHIPRSVYLCQSQGLNVRAVAAADGFRSTTINGVIREIPACILAIFETNFDKTSQVLGDGSEPDLSRF